MIEEVAIGYPYKPNKGCFGYSSSIKINSGKRILFDVGGYNLRSLIKPLVNNIDCVVISHLHFDHCSNLDLFVNTNVPIYISKKEIEYYESEQDHDCDLFSYFNYIKEKINIVLVEKATYIEDKVKIIFTPGHTPGHISLEINDDGKKTLIAGDSLKSYKDYLSVDSYGNAFNGKDYVNTKKAIVRKYSVIYPGHSGKIVDGVLEDRMEVCEF